MESKTIVIEGPRLYPLQYQALFNDARYGIVEASTKAGKTVGCLVWSIEQIFRIKGVHWWVAPVYPQARIAYERAKEMLPKVLYEANESRLELKLINGSVWQFKSADKPDSLYGEDVYSAVVDEASRVKEGSWIAVRSTLTATRGKVRIIGNVKGRGNWFYKIARRAQAGEAGYSYAKITAQDAVDAGVLAQEEIDDARRTLPAHVFKELYEAEASDDGGNPFGVASIDLCIAPVMSSEEPICWGWDLAKSHDWTVGIALDANGSVCRLERFQKSWKETVKTIVDVTGNTPALVDSTGVGDPILEELQVSSGRSNYEGFKFSSASKQQLMEGLSVAIQSGEIQYPDGVIVQELEVFEFEYTRTGVRYSAPSGLHDDAVCALALAWENFRRTPKSRQLKPILASSRSSRFGGSF